MYILSPHADCNIVGGDTQNYKSLQPTTMTGYFSYLIPCSGTLVAVNATGFCILTERTHKEVSLLFVIYRENDAVSVHLVPADCDFANRNSVSEIDYSFGSVSDNDLKIPVISDEVLGIGFFTTCSIDGCPFQPAIINNTSTQMLWFIERDKPVNEAKDISNVSLLFSATIQTASEKRGKNHYTTYKTNSWLQAMH